MWSRIGAFGLFVGEGIVLGGISVAGLGINCRNILLGALLFCGSSEALSVLGLTVSEYDGSTIENLRFGLPWFWQCSESLHTWLGLDVQ